MAGSAAERKSSDKDAIDVHAGAESQQPHTPSGTLLSGPAQAVAGARGRGDAANGPPSISGRRRAARRRERDRGPRKPEDRVGELLSGTYRIERLIAMGGMGAVYEVSHTRLEQHFAVKFLDPSFANNAEAYARFRREAEIASNLDHNNVVQVFDFNTDAAGNPYMVMEFVQAPTLDETLSSRGKLEPKEVLGIYASLCPALDACHDAGIVHRDLKPSNMIADLSGKKPVVKLLDFGISKMKAQGDDAGMTRDNIVMGTPNYMSPEQAQGRNTSLDRRTDVFALGAILYELLSGLRAFDADSLPQILHAIVYEQPKELVNVPAAVNAVIAKSMAKSVDERYQTAGELLAGLEAAYRSLRRRIPKEGPRRSPLWMAWTASLAVAVGGSYLIWGIHPASHATSNVSKPTLAQAQTPAQDVAPLSPTRDEFADSFAGGPAALVLEHDGQLYRADASGVSYWTDPEALAKRQVLPSAAPVTALSLSAGGHELLVGHADGTLSRWDRTLSTKLDVRDIGRVSVDSLAGGSDYLAVASGRELSLFNTVTGRKIKSFRIDETPVSMLMTRGEENLLIVVQPRVVELFEVDNRNSVGTIELGGRAIRAGVASEKPDRNPRFWVDFHQGDWTMRRTYSVERIGKSKARLDLVAQERRANGD